MSIKLDKKSCKKYYKKIQAKLLSNFFETNYKWKNLKPIIQKKKNKS